jgi:hypothetical protein
MGLWGLGWALLHCVCLRLPSPLRQVTALLLGVLALSLTVQLIAMAEAASASVLRAIWWIVVILGAVHLIQTAYTKTWMRGSSREKCKSLPMAITCAAIVTNLLVALAPSTKIDELYYHMLVPSRIISDGTLRFYRQPWEGAIWPDMLYQISATPAHAMGFPDATNVVSWSLSATLLWFAWRIIRPTKPAPWAAWTASLCVGMYPVVWHGTGGPHAMGDLAMAAAIVTFCSRQRTLVGLPAPAYAALLSILLLSASASKVTLLPVSVVLLCAAAWPLFRSAGPMVSGQIVLAMLAPWIVFFCPILLWTWIHSGSPFGPILSGTLGPSIYPEGWSQQTFQLTRLVNQPPLVIALKSLAVAYSPLIWLGALGAIFATDLPKFVRASVGCVFGLQCVLIYWLLPTDARFLGGLHYGLAIVFASYVSLTVMDRLASARHLAAASVLFLLPWLVMQLYYAKQFFFVSFGQEKAAFYGRYVAFYSDFVKLDHLLPTDAVLFVQDFRLDAAYAPRPVYFDRADLPKEKQVFLFASPATVRTNASFDRNKSARIVYENSQAVTMTYRTPGSDPLIGPLQVAEFSAF